MSLGPALLISFLLLGISILYCETTDLDARCTPPINNAADECTVKDSECNTNTCACKTGFIKENGACPKALGQVCVNKDECVSNSKCEGTVGSKTCSCIDGFGDKAGLCSKILGGDCKAGGTCPDDLNAECKGDKCVCKTDYAAKNDVCTQTVDGIDCSSVKTACATIQNAACDATSKKCKCNPDFIMNVNKCDPKNSAALMKFGVVLIVLSLLTAFSLW
ncbi:protein kinase C-binding protein NELL2-like isoform X1 [Ruditapes philippinarum]|uniref:protein kinase C-binding protein NELL2-like isoform X1 n=1 Tax=Ruditapes philippinarum TaxID=129788 RepID=UPI00295B4931|nr:protein kinase C-binding protein NELL2-like isoform X1 [Ruditapes philippinarum]